MEIINNKDSLQEKVKKEQWVRRVERDLKGNPNLKDNKQVNIPSPSEQDVINLEFQDHLGNPIPGYKWMGGKIVPENTMEIIKIEEDIPNNTKSIHIHKGNLNE